MTSNVKPPEDYHTWRMNVIKNDLNTNSKKKFKIPLNNDGKNPYGIDPGLFPNITEEKYKQLVQKQIDRDNELMERRKKVESSNREWLEKRRNLIKFNENKNFYKRGIESGAPNEFLEQLLNERGASEDDIKKIINGGKKGGKRHKSKKQRKTKKRRKTVKKGGKKRKKISRKKTKKRRSSK